MSVFWRGYLAGVLSFALVAMSCHPFPCRTGVVGASVFMVCK